MKHFHFMHTYKSKAGFTVTILLLLFTSCNKLIDIPPPENAIISAELFKTDASAISAVTGLYSRMNDIAPTFANGGLTVYPGLSADELTGTSATPAEALEFETNSITPGNSRLYPIWGYAYANIYKINACIHGIRESTTLSSIVKKQLLGECFTMRAFTYFNLINLFGKVPLILQTDYQTNMLIGRTDISSIKKQLLADLEEGEQLLSAQYPTPGVARPNKFTAIALKARYYLYEGLWNEAERSSTQVIESGLYSLVTDLEKIYLANSKEAIWQLMPVSTYNTTEGNSFIPAATAVPAYAVSDSLLKAFEPADKRKTSWMASKTVAGKTYFYPFKYKERVSASATVREEYYMMFRLAEQYLVRSEARAQQGKLTGDNSAASDINAIRNRAGLPNTDAVTFAEILSVVEKERRIELFCEWGHRWFDLKRWNKADEVLKKQKPAWQSTDVLYPIPESDILLNNQLTQNEGYN